MAAVDIDDRYTHEFQPYLNILNDNQDRISSITFNLINTQLYISFFIFDEFYLRDDVDTTIRIQLPIETFLEIYSDGFDITNFRTIDKFVIEYRDVDIDSLHCDFIKLFYNSNPRIDRTTHRLFIEDFRYIKPSFLSNFNIINVNVCYANMFNHLFEKNAFVKLTNLYVTTLLGDPCEDMIEKNIILHRDGINVKKSDLPSFRNKEIGGEQSECHDLHIFLYYYEVTDNWRELRIRNIKISDESLMPTYRKCFGTLTKNAVKF